MKDRIARAEEIQRYTENRCEALEKQIADADYQLEGRDNEIRKLEKENAELKVENAFCEKSCEGADQMRKDLKMAKEIIQKLLDTQYRLDPYRDIFKDRIAEAKQFISEVKI